MTTAADYEQDFQAWITRNVELLRAGRLSEIDAPHVAEELESMGKHDLRQLRSRLQVLTMHLLKWQYQPKQRGNSWLRTIDHQRDEIEALLLDSPSLRTGLQRGADHDVPEGGQRSGPRNRRVGKHLPAGMSLPARRNPGARFLAGVSVRENRSRQPQALARFAAIRHLYTDLHSFPVSVQAQDITSVGDPVRT